MQLSQANKTSEQTLERMFTAKYPWLLRWAMHFAQNDPALAEDLVQDTFVRLLLLKGSLANPDEIEPLLYTHLRYAYLSFRRHDRGLFFRSLSTIDFDTFTVSLRTSASVDQLEVQNNLRQVLVYLLWRRRAARFASIFLLRFFHELSHEEIARVCLISRHAVDLALARARDEMKAYLKNPQQFRVMGRGLAPEFRAVSSVLPSDVFSVRVMTEIFTEPVGYCPSNDQRRLRYETLPLRALETDPLAHLVSCKRCLEWLHRNLLNPPSSTPPPDLPRSSRSSLTTQNGFDVKRSFARVFANAQKQLRQTLEHHPSELVLAVNGEVIAVRDISSPSASLRIELHSLESLELVEVYSGHGISMLSLPISKRPPESLPEIASEIILSGERTLDLVLKFTADGAVVETHYFDPQFEGHPANLEDNCQADTVYPDETSDALESRSILPEAQKRQRRVVRMLGNILDTFRSRPLIPALITAALLIVAVWSYVDHNVPKIGASDLLRNAVRSERRANIAFGPGVVHQTIRVRFKAQEARREIYRDVDGRRHARHSGVDPVEQELKAKIAEAEMDWNDPLSAADFDLWRARLASAHDRVESAGSGLLRLITSSADGPIAEESLTVRLHDFHAVARNITLRDREAVEVAEVSYELLPWGPELDKLFEASPSSTSPNSKTLSPLRLPRTTLPSQDELDVAHLSVLVALQELQADTERVEIQRTNEAINVTGIVETDERRAQIQNRLRSIPHVTAHIRSYREVAEDSGSDPQTMSLKTVTVVSGGSPLDALCATLRFDRGRCKDIAQHLLRSSALLGRETMRIADLNQRFPPARLLTPTSHTLLNQLIEIHLRRLQDGLREQEDALAMLGPSSPVDIAPAPLSATDLYALVKNNQSLIAELVYANSETARKAPSIIDDLELSARQVSGTLPQLHREMTAGIDK